MMRSVRSSRLVTGTEVSRVLFPHNVNVSERTRTARRVCGTTQMSCARYGRLITQVGLLHLQTIYYQLRTYGIRYVQL